MTEQEPERPLEAVAVFASAWDISHVPSLLIPNVPRIGSMRQGVNSSDKRNMVRVWCVFRLLVGSLALMLASPYAGASLVISEFMASNGSSLVDEDGDNSDWLEIHNEGDSAVSLEGMYLTDDPENLTR